MTSQHTPAWKRLGLKLKYATEGVIATEPSLEHDSSNRKRKQSAASSIPNGSDKENHQLKKPRFENGTEQKQPGTMPQAIVSHSSQTNFPRRKKSVSFSSDTKVDDGDTAQTIQFWHPASSDLTSTDLVNDSADSHHTTPKKLEKQKKKKQPRSQPKQPSSAVPRKASAALDYLDQFQHQRSSWKFNKNHETWILKHALSIEHIPPAQNLALALYLRGLKSVGAKKRLVEQSRKALETDDTTTTANDGMLSNELLKVLDEDHRGVENHVEQPEWLKTSSRGKLVLFSLDKGMSEPTQSPSTNGQMLPRVKKNKSRTSRVDIESSSSDEDTEDEESETSASTGVGRNRVPNGSKAEGSTIDDTSSDASTDTSDDSSEESSDSD